MTDNIKVRRSLDNYRHVVDYMVEHDVSFAVAMERLSLPKATLYALRQKLHNAQFDFARFGLTQNEVNELKELTRVAVGNENVKPVGGLAKAPQMKKKKKKKVAAVMIKKKKKKIIGYKGKNLIIGDAPEEENVAPVKQQRKKRTKATPEKMVCLVGTPEEIATAFARLWGK